LIISQNIFILTSNLPRIPSLINPDSISYFCLFSICLKRLTITIIFMVTSDTSEYYNSSILNNGTVPSLKGAGERQLRPSCAGARTRLALAHSCYQNDQDELFEREGERFCAELNPTFGLYRLAQRHCLRGCVLLVHYEHSMHRDGVRRRRRSRRMTCVI